MTAIAARFWRSLVHWFEYGDLVPLLVAVSAAHYIAILKDHDLWVVAVAIGLLVDLGHYRWVRAAARYSGDNRRQAVIRWLLALLFTCVSLAYHQRFYSDWWLSAPLPLLIASLAWLSQVDARIGKRPIATAVATKAPAKQIAKRPVANLNEAQKSLSPARSKLPAKPSERKAKQRTAAIRCPVTGCDYIAANQNALNAHMRVHKKTKPDAEIRF